MDNKTIALIGALLVLGVAIYGMATGNLPGTENLGGDESEDSSDNTIGDNLGDNSNPGGTPTSSGGGGNQAGGNTTGNTTGNMTGNVTVSEPEPLPVVCEEQGSDFSSEDIEVPKTDPLNTVKAEAMLHNRLNQLRASRGEGLVNPLTCDPELREIARDHSQLILIQEGSRGGDYITSDYEESQSYIRSLGGELELEENLESLTRDDVVVNDTRLYEREGEEVCENPVREHGQYVYNVNIEGGDSGDFSFEGADFGEDQELTRIDNEEDLVRDARRVFGLDNLDTITNPNMERQGIGIAIDRNTNEVVITQIVCGPRIQVQSQNQNR